MQHDFDITTADANSGSDMRAAINAALQALASLSSGSTAPGTTYPFQWWLDTSTTPKTLRIRNSANTAWVVAGTLSDAGAFLSVNSDKVDGYDASQAADVNQIPVFNAQGNLFISGETTYPLLDRYRSGVYQLAGERGTTVLRSRAATYLASNLYWNGTAWCYQEPGTASLVKLFSNGTFTISTAPSGTAYAAATLTEQTVWHSGNDGTGSGLDADLLNNKPGANFPYARSEAGLRIIRGNVAANGTITAGSGFSISKTGTGAYTVTFTNAFTAAFTFVPSIVATVVPSVGEVVSFFTSGLNTVSVGTATTSVSGSSLVTTAADKAFHFIAIGPN